MMFDFLRSNPTAYLKRAATLLEEAHMARIEHQAAAEHHAALARMYAERVRRLESEVYRPQPQGSAVAGAATAELPEERPQPQLYSLDAAGRRAGLSSAN